jgi:hypothetical protein
MEAVTPTGYSELGVRRSRSWALTRSLNTIMMVNKLAICMPAETPKINASRVYGPPIQRRGNSNRTVLPVLLNIKFKAAGNRSRLR